MTHFFFDTISTYSIAFGDLFNNLKVQVVDTTVSPNKIIEKRVPLSYSHKLHWYLRKYQSLPDDFNVSTTLPRMVFSFNGIDAAYGERGTNKFERIVGDVNWTNEMTTWMQHCTPYTFIFTLSIWTKYQSEMNQLLEQILPFFNPSRNIHVKEIPILNIYRTCRISLGAIAQEHAVEFESESGDRILNYSMDFQIDGYMYPPIQQSALPTNLLMRYYDSQNIQITETHINELPLSPVVYGIHEGVVALQPITIDVLRVPGQTYEAFIDDMPYELGSLYNVNGAHVLTVNTYKVLDNETHSAQTIVNFEVNIPVYEGPLDPYIGGVENNVTYKIPIFIWLNSEYIDTDYTFELNDGTTTINIPHEYQVEGIYKGIAEYTVTATATKDGITKTKSITFTIDRTEE